MNKIRKVLTEFKHHTLKTYTGKRVTKRRQAIAIAMSEQAKFNKQFRKHSKRAYTKSRKADRVEKYGVK